MVCQDWIETSLLQLFAQQENSEWFLIISAIVFEVNIVAERNKNIDNDLLVFYKFPFPSTFVLPLPFRCFGVPEKKHEWKRSIATNKAQILKPIFF